MTGRRNAVGRVLVLLAASIIGSACIAEKASLPSETVIVIVPGDSDAGDSDSAASSPMPETALGQTPVTMTAGQDLSCVKGPHWILYEWVAAVAEGETVDLLARSEPEWPDYYYARKAGGTECWVFGGSSTITGDAANLPVREAPPLPQVTYRIDNQTGLTVCSVFIREEGDGSWGDSRLGGVLLEPGNAFDLTLTAGFYDVLIQACPERAVLYEEYDRAIGPEAGYRHTLLDIEVDIQVVNFLGVDVCAMSYKPFLESTWRVLHSIEDGVIAPDEGVSVRLQVGHYDFRYSRCAGPSYEGRNFAVLPYTTEFRGLGG